MSGGPASGGQARGGQAPGGAAPAAGGSAWRYGRPTGRSIEPDPRSGDSAGWILFGYLISGMAVYGGIGWLIGHWTRVSLLFPLGLLVGLGLGILLIVLKYGRPSPG